MPSKACASERREKNGLGKTVAFLPRGHSHELARSNLENRYQVPFTLGVREPRTSGSVFAELRRHRSAVLGGAATFAVLLSVVLGLASAEARRLEAERALTQETELRRVSSVLTKDLDVALGELKSLAFWLERDPEFATSRVEEYSRRLFRQYPTLRATVVLEDDATAEDPRTSHHRARRHGSGWPRPGAASARAPRQRRSV